MSSRGKKRKTGERREVRSIVKAVVRKTGEESEVLTRGGFDKARWLKRIREVMETTEPFAHKEVEIFAVNAYYAEVRESYIRGTHEGAISDQKDLDKIKATLRTKDEIVQIPTVNGLVTRLRSQCTRMEMSTLGRQYRRSGNSDIRKADFYDEIAYQMALAGFSDHDTVGDFMDATG